jgi:hypothetical protein
MSSRISNDFFLVYPFQKPILFRLINVTDEEYSTLHRNLTDGSKKAMLTKVSLLKPLPDPTNSPYAVVKEKIFTDLVGLKIDDNSVFYESYLEKVMHLVESGIIEKITSHLKPLKKQSKDDDPVALSIDHLLIWFQLWGGFLMIALLFFLLEIVIAKIRFIILSHHQKLIKQIWESIEDI